jgi:hypothetical protein
MRRVQAGLPFAVLLLCVAWSGTAAGQYKPPQVQIPPIEMPQPPQEDWAERTRQWQLDEERRQAAIAQFAKSAGPAHNPASDYASPEQLMRWMETGFAVLAVGLLGWAGLWLYTRWPRQSDPMKYVMSDPWVQAHLNEAAPPKDDPQ